MSFAVAHPVTVPFDASFSVSDAATRPPDSAAGEKALKKALKKQTERISELQRTLYADNRFAVLLVFQAMDAAGKDSTIRAVMSGVNPAGCQVSSFKSPSKEELDHDFLWRSAQRLPERGRIGVFNRSYYEEVLAVRVHPAYLNNQRLPSIDPATVWKHRFESIRDHERHLARNGTVVLKFWLNVSPEEQRRRFLSRLTTPRKYWKFSAGDLDERDLWEHYMAAYESLLNETSRPCAPWYAIPADHKPYMRLTVAEIIADTLESLPLAFPEKSAEQLAEFEQHINRLDDSLPAVGQSLA